MTVGLRRVEVHACLCLRAVQHVQTAHVYLVGRDDNGHGVGVHRLHVSPGTRAQTEVNRGSRTYFGTDVPGQGVQRGAGVRLGIGCLGGFDHGREVLVGRGFKAHAHQTIGSGQSRVAHGKVVGGPGQGQDDFVAAFLRQHNSVRRSDQLARFDAVQV